MTVSSTGSTLSESSLNDLSRRSITPDLIFSGSTSDSSNSNTTISSYGSNASGRCFRISNTSFPQNDSRISESELPYRTTLGDNSALQNTPPIVISPPRQDHSIDGSTPSPSPVTERMPQRLRTGVAQRLLSLVDSNDRPIRLVKRSVLKNITNIAKPRSSAPEDDECIEDAHYLIYRPTEEFLPTLVSTPPTCNAPYSDSGFFGSFSRFGDIYSSNALTSTTPVFTLPESFKFSDVAGCSSPGDILTANYQHEYPDYYEDGVVMGNQFEWGD